MCGHRARNGVEVVWSWSRRRGDDENAGGAGGAGGLRPSQVVLQSQGRVIQIKGQLGHARQFFKCTAIICLEYKTKLVRR